jgi:hypothetical protein
MTLQGGSSSAAVLAARSLIIPYRQGEQLALLARHTADIRRSAAASAGRRE